MKLLRLSVLDSVGTDPVSEGSRDLRCMGHAPLRSRVQEAADYEKSSRA